MINKKQLCKRIIEGISNEVYYSLNEGRKPKEYVVPGWIQVNDELRGKPELIKAFLKCFDSYYGSIYYTDKEDYLYMNLNEESKEIELGNVDGLACQISDMTKVDFGEYRLLLKNDASIYVSAGAKSNTYLWKAGECIEKIFSKNNKFEKVSLYYIHMDDQCLHDDLLSFVWTKTLDMHYGCIGFRTLDVNPEKFANPTCELIGPSESTFANVMKRIKNQQAKAEEEQRQEEQRRKKEEDKERFMLEGPGVYIFNKFITENNKWYGTDEDRIKFIKYFNAKLYECGVHDEDELDKPYYDHWVKTYEPYGESYSRNLSSPFDIIYIPYDFKKGYFNYNEDYYRPRVVHTESDGLKISTTAWACGSYNEGAALGIRYDVKDESDKEVIYFWFYIPRH